MGLPVDPIPSREPLPSGVRREPPRFPPAPPGAPSTPPPSGEPTPIGGDFLIALNATRNTLLMMRMAVEALPATADVPEARNELRRLLEEARGDLAAHLRALRHRVTFGFGSFPDGELRAIKHHVRTLARHGVDRGELDTAMRTTVFSETPEAYRRYRYEVETGQDWERSAALPTSFFPGWLLQHLIERIDDEASYADLVAFDAQIYRRVLFVLYAVTSATAWYYGTGDEFRG